MGSEPPIGGPGPERTNEKCYCLLILLSWIVGVTTLMNACDETCFSVQKTLKLVYDEHLNNKTAEHCFSALT